MMVYKVREAPSSEYIFLSQYRKSAVHTFQKISSVLYSVLTVTPIVEGPPSVAKMLITEKNFD